ncbi:unnamed protein product, partial [Didymodactylos carnosus]
CVTCTCNDQETGIVTLDSNCIPLQCSQVCKYGFERDEFGCQLCSCNKCPLHTCRMFCLYGFQKDEDGCDKCECDSTPIENQITCSDKEPCKEGYVCNLDILTCEAVPREKINYFMFYFDIDKSFFDDQAFLDTYKNDFIQNLASTYGLLPAQIFVFPIQPKRLTNFQIMPFFREDKDDFQRKMDQIDADIDNDEFRRVLPSVTSVIRNKWKQPVISDKSLRQRNRLILILIGALVVLLSLIIATVFFILFRRRFRRPGRSQSK